MTDDQIKNIYEAYTNFDKASPADVFLIIIHITRLRVQIASKASTKPADIGPTVGDLLDRLCSFQVDSWMRDRELEDPDASRILAHIYQVAAGLYGIVTLPPSAVASWARQAGYQKTPGLDIYHSVRKLYALDLMAQLRHARSALLDAEGLVWPLVVLGVAAAYDTSAKDKDWIAQQLFEIWLLPNNHFAPITCRRKLQAFWSSGNTAWDDCFDEPVPST